MNYYHHELRNQLSERDIADLTFALQDIVESSTILITSKNLTYYLSWLVKDMYWDKLSFRFFVSVGDNVLGNITVYDSTNQYHVSFNINEKIVMLMKNGKKYLPNANESKSSFLSHLIKIMEKTGNKLDLTNEWENYSIHVSENVVLSEKNFAMNMIFYLSLFYNINNFNYENFIADSINYFKDGGNSELYHRANSFKGVTFFLSRYNFPIKIPVFTDYVKPEDLMIKIEYYFVSTDEDISTGHSNSSNKKFYFDSVKDYNIDSSLWDNNKTEILKSTDKFLQQFDDKCKDSKGVVEVASQVLKEYKTDKKNNDEDEKFADDARETSLNEDNFKEKVTSFNEDKGGAKVNASSFNDYSEHPGNEKNVLHDIYFIIKHFAKLTKLDTCSVLINNVGKTFRNIDKSNYHFVVYWNNRNRSNDVIIVMPDKTEQQISINEHICELIVKGCTYDRVDHILPLWPLTKLLNGQYKLLFSSLEKVIMTRKITKEDIIVSSKSWEKTDITIEAFSKHLKFYSTHFNIYAYLNHDLTKYYSDSIAWLTNGDDSKIDCFLKKNCMDNYFVQFPQVRYGNMPNDCPYPR